MSTPFTAEIRIFPFNFAPKNWAFCNGQIIPISQNTALFSLLGVQYGGNGTSNFALPNLQASAAIGTGQGSGLSDYVTGQTGGAENVTVLNSEMPMHNHTPNCVAGLGGQASPANAIWAKPHVSRAPDKAYAAASNCSLNPLAVNLTGGTLPHNNMPPYLTLNFCIALFGVFPARN